MQINEDVLREVEAALAAICTVENEVGAGEHHLPSFTIVRPVFCLGDIRLASAALASLRKAMEDGKDG